MGSRDRAGREYRLIEAYPDTTDLFSAVSFATELPGVSVVSMSWGASEFSGETSYDSIFTTPAGHNGITFVASSGDSVDGRVSLVLAERPGGRRHHPERDQHRHLRLRDGMEW